MYNSNTDIWMVCIPSVPQATIYTTMMPYPSQKPSVLKRRRGSVDGIKTGRSPRGHNRRFRGLPLRHTKNPHAIPGLRETIQRRQNRCHSTACALQRCLPGCMDCGAFGCSCLYVTSALCSCPNYMHWDTMLILVWGYDSRRILHNLRSRKTHPQRGFIAQP